MKYILVSMPARASRSAIDMEKFEEMVEARLHVGWKPQGGVSVTTIGTLSTGTDVELLITQALVSQ